MSARLGGMNLRRLAVHSALALVMAVTTLVLMPQQAHADACSTNGRNCYYGYFSGNYDGGPGTLQHNVWSPPAMLNVNNASELIASVRGHLGCGDGRVDNDQNGVGAAFIVLTMLGRPPGTPKNTACQLYSEWVSTVQYWAPYTRYNVFYNFGGLNTRSNYKDVAYYPSAQQSAWSIVFYSPTTGAPLYAIKKDCANPVGRLRALNRPQNYTLTPHVDSVSPTEIESGGKMSVTSSVNNVGDVNSNPTQWEITQITVRPGKKAPHEDDNGTASPEAPCQSNGGAPAGNYFRSGDADCRNVAKGAGVFNRGSPAQNRKPSVSGVDIGDVPAGTRICFALSVQPRSNSDVRWAHSKPICTVVGKKPKVQIWGGDVAVRGRVETSTSVKTISGTTKTFGSWVEYGAFSVGVNSRFASGSGLADQTSNSQVAWSKLTFANKNAVGANAFGRYAPASGFRSLPGVASFFTSVQNKQPIGAPSVDINSLTFATGDPVVVHTAGNLTITGSSIPAGRSVVILASGTVTIDGDITYTDAAINSLNDIPQAVIIANNIMIKDSVNRVDSWLVASGVINTCHNFTGNLTTAKCAGRLEVNGPVITGRLLLNRTAGSETGTQSGDPGERFNLRPDAHLWAQLQSRGSNKAQTVYSVELPPRF